MVIDFIKQQTVHIVLRIMSVSEEETLFSSGSRISISQRGEMRSHLVRMQKTAMCSPSKKAKSRETKQIEAK